MIAGERRAGASSSETTTVLRFSVATVSGCLRIGDKEKNSSDKACSSGWTQRLVIVKNITIATWTSCKKLPVPESTDSNWHTLMSGDDYGTKMDPSNQKSAVHDGEKAILV
ncbi:hypothetical protein TNCT_344771 [Trichonephila clavata]|uniref:Uncharacterized protein n=1 Tax=Trichonephila clavata TaxID=2740835 RepID=A0A8X6JET8_TRICU|nr:hypothetical protein TNCT_344771 [Trichonephila clavata]